MSSALVDEDEQQDDDKQFSYTILAGLKLVVTRTDRIPQRKQEENGK